MNVPEKLLHYVWQHRLFLPSDMQTTTGESVEVINVGLPNSDGGPDFFNAQVKIGNVLWAGNIEIHCNADDWFAHHHDSDAAYDNVILHVVGELGQRKALTSKGMEVAECVLRFPDYIVERYNELNGSPSPILCSEKLSGIAKIKCDMWLERLLYERMEQLETRVLQYLETYEGDWDQAFFILLARAMGGSVNSQPMELLARKTPLRVVKKHPELLQVEALLMGQSGLLGACSDDDEYTQELRREYDFLRTKFSLSPMEATSWKHLRMRPSNFPEIRIAQLAAVLSVIPGNFENYFKSLDVEAVKKSLSVSASAYWSSHYRLTKLSSKQYAKHLGDSQKHLIISNAVVPFVFTSLHRLGKEEEMNNVLKFMQFLPSEHNSKLTQWSEAGIEAKNEGEAQARFTIGR